MTGPKIPIAIETDIEKYRQAGETFGQKCSRIATTLSDTKEHYDKFVDILKEQRFLPGGRIQSAIGATRKVTAFNCFVMQQVPDTFDGIMDVAKEAGATMRMGGGVGYDFSGIRPKGAPIKSLDSKASGPVSFMGIFDSVCGTIASAGHRRGAQMACLRVDHPDILEYVTAKNNTNKLVNFNTSVLVTDTFMEAVINNEGFDLVFDGKVYETVNASALWDTIMRSTWDWAEPGVIFIDRVNKMNNLWYLEDISATNPCGEQPLPPYGACLLGSFNLTKYVWFPGDHDTKKTQFQWERLKNDIPYVVRAMDNVIDRTIYPLPQQEEEAKSKRRMGLGITGLANTLTAMGMRYGSTEALMFLDELLGVLANTAYRSSVELAIEKGPFPAYVEDYNKSEYLKVLKTGTRDLIKKHGIRNSHLISIAPTGTISLTANNVSSGLEPVYRHEYSRDIITGEGAKKQYIQDYAYMEWGLKGDTVKEVTVEEHIDTLCTAQKWVDSAISKTCNVGSDVTWEQFKYIYLKAYLGGAKGCTTHREDGKRTGILHAEPEVEQGGACYIDLETGMRSCE